MCSACSIEVLLGPAEKLQEDSFLDVEILIDRRCDSARQTLIAVMLLRQCLE